MARIYAEPMFWIYQNVSSFRRKTIMKKIAFALFTVLPTICVYFPLSVFAQDSDGSKSQVTVPWQEFKQLLRIDDNEVVLPLDTFNRLVAQTGSKTKPAHAIREGFVVMTRAQFQALVEKMVVPPDSAAAAPFEFLITKATYSGKMTRTSTRFTARFQVHVLKREGYIKIPLLYQNMALEDIKVDGKPALVISENGFHQTIITKPGEHTAEAVFSLKTNLEQGPFRLDLNVIQTPITLLQIEMPLAGIDVDIPQAQTISMESRSPGTVVSAVINPGSTISIAWRKKVPVQEKLPPKLYAEVTIFYPLKTMRCV
jgi:hypothetical protein